uniref:Glyco_hydro_92 n=1 Tax=uncultured Sanguibacter sp. TaxID=435288 RepID=A0A060C8S5_9MICO|nr:Glyco_hydro_92 [uncultured Sanguibacter sp.]
MASGLYPLSIGSGEYVITAPMLPRLCWNLEGGARLEITAPGAGPDRPYVQRVWIDGEQWEQITVPASG